MTALIEKMIVETQQWQKAHRSNGRQIEAAACAIRVRALQDAMMVIEALEGKE